MTEEIASELDALIPISNNICLSGGADGADLQWGMTAGQAGHMVIHWSFRGHRSTAPASEIIVLPDRLLQTADAPCVLANHSLKRRFPPKSNYVRDLLRRDWFQVCYTDSCYAVSTFGLPPNTIIPIGGEIEGEVDGGTAWAVQMFIDRHKGASCPCYMFDQEACYWFEWQGKWVRIYEPPKPQGLWTGIGKRKLNSIGKVAIRVLLDYKGAFTIERRIPKL